MSQSAAPGTIQWVDLTVEDAESIRSFYERVVGWKSDAVQMGRYNDFNMISGDQAVAGICHARGSNADLPPQWLMYVEVADIDASVSACEEAGGTVLRAAMPMGGGRCAVIRDPAGACLALFQSN